MTINWSEMLIGVETMIRSFVARLPHLVVGLIVFFILYLLGRTISHFIVNVTEKRKRHRNLGLVLGRLTRGLTIFVALLIALVIAIPSFKPGQLVQLLGISSVAIGFAFRDIFQNFLAGILLLLAEPFRIGDQIKVRDFEGTVEDIQTRATFIRTYDGRRIVIPNSDLFTEPVIVNTAFEKRRQEYDIGIGYGDNPQKAKELILEALKSVPDVQSDPAPDVLFYELGAASVNIRARWWVQPPARSDALDSRDRVLGAVKQKLLENGIDLPFPTQQILFHDQTEETDGNRVRQREGWPSGSETGPRSRTIAGALYKLADLLQAKNGNGSDR